MGFNFLNLFLIFQISGLGLLIAGIVVLNDVTDFNHFLEGRITVSNHDKITIRNNVHASHLLGTSHFVNNCWFMYFLNCIFWMLWSPQRISKVVDGGM
jgi:hypothetical protein